MATARDLKEKAKEAFVDDNFELAADLYSQALALDPACADLYADRAQANIKIGSFTEVVLTIFAKGIAAGNVSVDFGEQTLRCVIDVPGEDSYHFQPRLFGKIIPDKCRYHILSTKIEIRLAKEEPITWTSLEFSDKKTVQQKINTMSAPSSQKPSYPSSKSKTDWDKVVAEVKKEEKEEKLDGDAALHKFFRYIYQDADEDTRRAISKSFVESNGTVLSTNWKDVGKKKVEGSPPDGMELKKWEF